MSSVSILAWCNLFTASARIAGIPRALRLVNRLASALPSAKLDLDATSDRFDRVFSKWKPLFFANGQKCMLRGLTLLFYAKRAKLPVRLVFGTRRDGEKLLWHCWLLEDGNLRYERPEVIAGFAPFFEGN
jgi:hypothetical protein